MSDYIFDERTYNFTDNEIDALVDLVVWYCEGHLAPYDMRKLKSRRVKSWATDRMHCILVKAEDGKHYAASYHNVGLDTIQFDPVYQLPPEVVWRLFSRYVFDNPTGITRDGKRTIGYSVTKSRGWLSFNVYPSTNRFFSKRDMDCMYFVMSILASHQYVTFLSAGSVWDITEL